MALKLEHTCTRCNKTIATEVSDVQAATRADEMDKKRAIALKDIEAGLAGIEPNLLPDLLIVRRGRATVVQTFLCDEADAKRSCATRVDALVEECTTFDPRKPKTKKAPAPPAPAQPSRDDTAVPAPKAAKQ